MWRNYLTVAVRSLLRHRTYAFINVVGLAIGIAACLLLLIYVRYETTFDTWLKDGDRVYQVQSISTADGAWEPQQSSHGVVSESLPQAFPEIEAIARMDGDQVVLLDRGEPRFFDLFFADPSLFRILQVPFLRGDPARVLEPAEALVLSRRHAMAMFGSIDVVGRTVTQIRRGERHERRITGVFEDSPQNSHLDLQMVGRISEEQKEDCGWGCINGYVYLKLRPGADAAAINARLAAWERRSIPPQDVGGVRVSEGDRFDWRLVNVRDVHLSGAEGEDSRPGNDRRTILTFSIVAFLILGMAAVNFVNLATARAGQRAREVALRKVLGARRRQLVIQFLSESLLIAGAATLLGVAAAELALPWLSAFLRAQLDFQYSGAGGMLLPIAGLWLAVGLAGGLYPAYYLSRYQPGEVLKANKSSAEPRGTGRLRSALVVGQFAVSIGLIVCTFVVYSQTLFAQRSDIGFQRQGLIQIGNANRAAVVPVIESLLREIERVPGVESAAGASISAASGTVLNTNVRVPGRSDPVTIGNYSVSPAFFHTMNIPLLAGRPLSRSYANDYGFTPYEPEEAVEPAQRAMAARGLNIVVTREAARRMGLGAPEQAVGKQVGLDFYGEEVGLLPATIVGVVEDSRFRSLREPVEPIIYNDTGIYGGVVVRFRASDPEAVRRQIGAVWRRVVPDVPFEGEFADQQLAELYATDAARGQTFAGFSLLAVVIACLGLFGLAAFTAERRTREIGLRKVLGARSRDIVKLLAWQFSKPVIVANIVAWPVAWWTMRDWLDGFDTRIDLGPGPFVLAGAIALAIAIGTIAAHALKVARANPIHALRYE
ncbi:MAG TPA: ABC transporter permease [Allosphingosinicella sp.]|jgi:putative ABC transport system permease protein